MDREPSSAYTLLVAAFAVVPAIHPLLIPVVGVPSHLLWFAHVLPVALVAYRLGAAPGGLAAAASGLLVVAGERAFGAGYGAPAAWETALSLSVAVMLVDGLIAVFAVYARRVTSRYQLLFDRVTLGVIRTDRSGVVRDVNPAAETILDAPASELMGRGLGGLVGSARLDDLPELARKKAWSGRLELGLEGSRRLRHVLVVAVPLPESDGFQVLIADRSVQELQEEEIRRQSKLATLGEALAGVAHEMNNPLTAIIGHAHLAAVPDVEAADRDEALDVIQGQAKRIQGLVQELLGFSRPGGGDGVESTSMAELVSRVVRVQRMALPDGVEVRPMITCNRRLCTAPTKMEQILINLVSNAADALAEGGGTIEVLCRTAGDWLEVEVRDDGPGIAEEVLGSIFQPFVTTKPEGQGTGLGLAISRRLARSMGGELAASNRPEGGASFVLRLDTTGARSEGSMPWPGQRGAPDAGTQRVRVSGTSHA